MDGGDLDVPFAVDFIYIMTVALIEAVRGHVEARIFFAAMLLPVALAVYDSLAGLGVVVRSNI